MQALPLVQRERVQGTRRASTASAGPDSLSARQRRYLEKQLWRIDGNPVLLANTESSGFLWTPQVTEPPECGARPRPSFAR